MIGHIFCMDAVEGENGEEQLEVTWGSNAFDDGGAQLDDLQICVVMVGLPARGKSLIAQKSRCHPAPAAVLG